MYHARDGRQHYPFEQELYSTVDGEHDESMVLESVDSFIAPSYQHDVSPPPFLTASGKPPTYSDITAYALAPEPPTQAPETARESQ
ncbi:hypothetical protein BGZ65_002822 [Modicella reniformis]|uniref:Uncharacterized protein n=1 Tax=Modicella reniformis TaxID=1440133 RepID=A0A9P6SNF4_9FUNG|nr:hypothetical protein BGZ65_002822 [Modicella reniformis]